MEFYKEKQMTKSDREVFSKMSIQVASQNYKERTVNSINMGLECNDGKPSAFAHESEEQE